MFSYTYQSFSIPLYLTIPKIVVIEPKISITSSDFSILQLYDSLF